MKSSNLETDGQAKREAFATMIEQCDLSERRACRFGRLSRNSYRHPFEVDAMTQEVSSKVVEITHACRCFGYRRIHDMLRPHFPSYPLAVRTDNGQEFTSRAIRGWGSAHGIHHILIEPGRPMQNSYIESFNGKFRDECLNEQWFETLQQARLAVSLWRQDYDEAGCTAAAGNAAGQVW